VVEEATQLPGDKISLLMGSLRTSREDFVPRIYLSTNPGRVGHAFVKERYVIPHRENREITTRRYFSSYRDNPFINPEYRTYLERLTGDLAKAWRDGDWDVFEGQAFPAWKHEKHVIKPFEIPANWTRWRAVDWGFSNPWCCLWFTRNPDTGRIFVYREAYETQLTDRQQAHKILDMTPPSEHITLTYADPAMWASKNLEGKVSTTANEYLDNGVPLTKADNDRLSGKRKLDRLLEPLPDGLPGIQYFSNCLNSIRTIPALVYDDTQVEDVDTKQEDHPFDTTKYGLTQAREYRQPAKPNTWTPKFARN
jgi:phage terminase large subunit